MAPNELNAAITKLQTVRDRGDELLQHLALGPSGCKAKDGEIKRAIKKVKGRSKVRISEENARKAMDFAGKYPPAKMMKLIKLCQKHDYCPEWGTMIRLLPFGAGDRNKLLKQVLVNRWTKADLDAELELLKPSGGEVDARGRGRPPKAAKSLHSLKGQAAIDARRWAHIFDLLQQEGAEFKLTKSRVKDLQSLTKLLGKISKWKG